MAIGVGSYVQMGSDAKKHGKVTAKTGDDVTFRTARGAYFTVKESQLTEREKSFGDKMSAQVPDLMELAANTVVFGGTQLVRKRKFFGEPTMRFAVEDAVYEFLLKGWLRENVEANISSTIRSIAQGDAADNFTSEDIMDALAKTISLGILDSLYKLAMKGKIFSMSHLYYALQMAASFYIANVGQRALRPKEGGFKN